MWLTMKPGLSMQTTGSRVISRAARNSRSTTSGLVLRPGTTSTSFISGTGLKKCRPATRSGDLHLAAMAVIDSDDVFEARMVCGAHIASRAANNACFASRRSTIASTIRSQPFRSSSLSTMATRPTIAAASSAVRVPFCTARSIIDLMNSRALSAAPAWASNSRTSAPPSTETWAMPRPMAPVPTMPILKLPSWSVIAADAAPVCRSDFCCRGTVARPDGSFNPLVTTTGLRATEGACTRSAGAMYCLARLSLAWGRNVA